MTLYLLSDSPAGRPRPGPGVPRHDGDLAALNQELQAAGAWVFTGGLHPASTATVLRARDGDAIVTDGPFAEGKEHLGGFTVIDAPDLDAALEWGKQARRATSLPDRGAAVRAADRSDRRRAEIERVFRESTGARWPSWSALLGDIDIAEDAVQDAFARRSQRGRSTACRPARRAGSSPRPGTGRSTGCAGRRPATTGTPRRRCCAAAATEPVEEGPVRDDRLRLIFTCCHPALAPRAQVALTLRLLGGLTTAEIARAFLVPEPTMAQRLVRAKAQDPRRPDPVPGAARGRAARPAARRARRGLPDLQRGLRGQLRATPWSATTCAPRRSGSAGCWPR